MLARAPPDPEGGAHGWRKVRGLAQVPKRSLCRRHQRFPTQRARAREIGECCQGGTALELGALVVIESSSVPREEGIAEIRPRGPLAMGQPAEILRHGRTAAGRKVDHPEPSAVIDHPVSLGVVEVAGHDGQPRHLIEPGADVCHVLEGRVVEEVPCVRADPLETLTQLPAEPRVEDGRGQSVQIR